jgi:hypothetical protein
MDCYGESFTLLLLTMFKDNCSIQIIKFVSYWNVWNGVHSALVRINEELLERQVAAPV